MPETALALAFVSLVIWLFGCAVGLFLALRALARLLLKSMGW